jgi:hypothetical protein
MTGFQFHVEAAGILSLGDQAVFSWVQVSKAVGTLLVDGDNLIVSVQLKLISLARVTSR